jgi:hypothetical protein
MSLIDHAQLAAAAEVDPWALSAQLSAGDPDQIEELAAAFYRAAGDAGDATASDARAKQYVRAGYRVDGGAPLDYNAEARRTSTALADAADKLPKIAKLLSSVAQDLASATGSAQAEVSALDGELASIEQQYESFMQTTGHHLPPDDQGAVRQGYLRDAVASVQRHGAATNKLVMDYEHALATATKSLADLGYVPPLELREAGEQPTAPLPVGTDPTTVAKWWAGLTPAQQEYLIDHEYATLGQLRGLPAPVLDTANRHRLTDDEAYLREQLGKLDAAPYLDPLGIERAALQHRLDQDLSIDKVVTGLGPGQPPAPILLLAYDPHGKEGQTGVAISYGNPDTAANTGVVVPGTSHSALDLASVARNGSDLYNTMSSSSKAVVVWLDGPEPQTLPYAALDKWANESAPNLVTDLAGLKAAHTAATGDGGHLTAVGHSYGSYILGKALTEGALADDAIFVGSPGVGVNSAKDLGSIDPAHVWDGQAGDDPILFTEKRFTPDPLTGTNPEDSDFGAQHFSVEGSSGHSQYYKGESLVNMARIADGDYGAVDRVPAPDYRGLRELPGDLISTGLTPIDTDIKQVKDLATGHPIKALEDGWDGAVDTAEDGVHVVEDLWPF